MNVSIIENRAVFTDTLFKASVRYSENEKEVRFPYIRIYTNDENQDDVAELRNIFGKETISFLSNDGRQRCVLNISVMPSLVAFIEFIMYEVRKNRSLMDVSKME